MQDNNSSIRTMSGLNFLVGLWLIISPYLLNYVTGQAMWQQTGLGVLIALLAAIRIFMPSQMWTSWVNALAGVWLIIAPFITGYTAAVAYWNEIVMGIVVLLIAAGNGLTRSSSQHYGNPAAM